jgi:uridine monophosphate synthetase
LVVGATYPAELARVRALAGDLWILAPGVGVQGGDLRQALQAGLRPDGLGMLIPVSRAVSRAQDTRRAVREMREEINQGREWKRTGKQVTANNGSGDEVDAWLADALLETGCVKFGRFTLKSGQQSPIYLDLRRLITYPRVLAEVARAYLPILKGITFDRLAGLPYAALPIATAISLQGGWPLVYPRKEAKVYGTKAEIEGVYQNGERVAVIDDLATTGGSKFEAIEKLTSAGLRVEDVVVLIDRQSGAAEALAQAGIRFHAVLTLTQMLDYWEKTGKVPADQIAAARAFIEK